MILGIWNEKWICDVVIMKLRTKRIKMKMTMTRKKKKMKAKKQLGKCQLEQLN